MKWAAGLSQRATLPDAIVEAVDGVLEGLRGESPDVVIASVTSHHGLGWSDLPGLVRERLGSVVVVGCTAHAVHGRGVEVEGGPGVSLLAGHLPGVAVAATHLPAELVNEPWSPDLAALHTAIGAPAASDPALLLFTHPTTCHAGALAEGLHNAYPRAGIAGGIAGGGAEASQAALFCGDRRVDEGAVVLSMIGDIEMDAIVAQGCQPLAGDLRITGMQGRAIAELDGRPALQVLQDTFQALDPIPRRLFQRSPMVGVAMDRAATTRGRGDYIVGPLLGVRPNEGAFAVSFPVAEDDVLRFHARDPSASVEDLDELLGRHARWAERPAAAFMVSCVGRGERFYGRANVDSDTVRGHLGQVPLAGFFGNGEVGPVHGRPFLHMQTTVLAMLRARAWN